MQSPSFYSAPTFAETSPQIPAGNGCVRLPPRRYLFHFGGLRQFVQTIGLLHGRANPQIGDRQHIPPAQREHEEHLRGPLPDPLHLRQVLDHHRVFRIGQVFEHDAFALRVLGQFLDIAGLLARQAELPHLLRAKFHDSGGRQPVLAGSGVQTAENYAGYPSAELLVDNGSDQRLKRGLPVLDGARTYSPDDGRYHGVRFFEMLKGREHMRTAGLILATLLILPIVLLRLPAQQRDTRQKVEDDAGEPIKVDVDVVNLYCAVRNKQNALISTLEKGDFALVEDGTSQTIKYFTRETDLPLTIGLLVDVSGSQRNLIEIERRAASAFFGSVLKKKDEAFLISFGADSELLQDLTGSPRDLQNGLNHLKLNAGFSGINSGPVPTMSHARGTVLYDAVYLAANDMLSKEAGRKAIVLITDGQDEGSTLNLKAAIEAAQKADAIIYGILYVDRQSYGPFGGGYSGESVLEADGRRDRRKDAAGRSKEYS